MIKLLDYDDILLRLLSYNVLTIDDQLRKEVEEMRKVMKESGGIGIAAPQVGLRKNVFLIELPTDKDVRVFINPVVFYVSKERILSVEGCLSLPGKQYSVGRYERIGIQYKDLNGEINRILASGLLAMAIQHELEHLQGVLIDENGQEYNRDQKTT